MKNKKFVIGAIFGVIIAVGALYFTFFANAVATRVGFENGRVLMDNPTDPNDGVNLTYLQSNYYSLLATTAAFSVTVTGTTDLYTVPTGYKLYMKHLDVTNVSVVTPSTSFSFTVGANAPGYDDWLASGVFGSATQDRFKTLMAGLPMAGSVIYPAGTVVKFNIIGAGASATHTIKVRVWGYLEPV